MNATDARLQLENRRMWNQIESTGKRLSDIMPDLESDPRVRNAQLHAVQAWMRAYTATPDRAHLEKQGFLYPPVLPGMDPDADWLLFTRWMAGLPTRWDYASTFGPLPEAATLSDADIRGLLDQIGTNLQSRGVIVDLQDGLPAGVAYRVLRANLLQESFEFLPEGTSCIVTGCDGCCPDCLQREWCEIGLDGEWDDEEEKSDLVAGEG